MSIALAIFVKTPGHSPIKTRLAATRGQAFAEEWHRRAAQAVASVARALQFNTALLTSYWAVAESAAMGDRSWRGLPRVEQGQGSLGTRLDRVYRRLLAEHSGVVMIGADSPQLTTEPLLQAGLWMLEPAARSAIGPACDGGFWLVAANAPLPEYVWTQVAYSGRETGRDMRCSLALHSHCRTLPGLTDVDTANDLAAVRAELEALPDPTREQASLTNWLRACEVAPA